MHELFREVDATLREHSFPALFSESTVHGVARLHAGLHAGSLAAFEAPVAQLQAPLLLLYVLHTPRGRSARRSLPERGHEGAGVLVVLRIVILEIAWPT